MSSRELVVLGTASQVPTRYRNHNGYLLLWDGVGVLFDPGEGTQRQMTLAGVRVHQIHAICVTHFHGDHCLGLPGVIQRISLDEVPHEVAVHYPASGQVYWERLRQASIFLDRSCLRPVGHAAAGPLGPVRAGATTVELSTARLDHGADAWGYRVDEADGWTCDAARLAEAGVRGPLVRALLDRGEVQVDGRVVRIDEVAAPRRGQSMAFIMDSRPCPGAERLAAGVDLLVCESTYLPHEAALAREHGHMTAREAAQLATHAGARRLVLTHFSQRNPDNEAYLEAARPWHADVVAARDLLRVPVPGRS